MKKLFLWMVLIAGAVSAHEGADHLFVAGRYKEALEAYRSQTQATASEYVRMGTCAFELDNHADALEYWLKALPELYGMAYVRISLRCASLQSIAPSPLLYLQISFAAIPPLIWQLLWILLLLLTFWFWYQCKRLSLVVYFCIKGVVVVSMLFLLSVRARTAPRVLCKKQISLYVGPDKRFATCATIPSLSVLSLLESDAVAGGERFMKVSAPSSRGWVRAADVTRL